MHRAVVRREGRDLTIVSYSRHALLSQDAATELAKEGLEAEVIDLRSSETIDWGRCAASLEKTHRLLVVEEIAVMAVWAPKSPRRSLNGASTRWTLQSHVWRAWIFPRHSMES